MRVYHVKKARKARPEHNIKVGDSYYWWKFRFGGKRFSKEYPKRSQLTQSGFLQTLYSIQDDFEFDRDDLENSVQDLISEIDQLREECECNLENMPEHLQESSSSGELLQERIDALEMWVSDIESVDLDIDEDLSDEDREERIDEIIEEIKGIDSGL